MGCRMAVWLELDDKATAVHLLREAETHFARNEQRLTRFTPTSELSRLNASPDQWTPVSVLLWQVVSQALALARETGGLFDPTLLASLEAAGYTRSFELLGGDVGEGDGTAVAHLGQWPAVGLDPDRQAIYLPPDLRLDLGGVAKGYTAAQVAVSLGEWGPCLVDAGGDLVAGEAPTGLPGWPVAIATPWHTSEGLCAETLCAKAVNAEAVNAEAPRTEALRLWLVGGAMATSGMDYRRWSKQGHLAHHLIDPRTGHPAITDVLTATVATKTAVRAEAWAKAALIAGTEVGFQLLTAHNMAGAFLPQAGGLILTPALQERLLLTNN